MNTEITLPRNPVHFWWTISKPYRGWLILSMGAVVVATVAGSSVSYILKLIIDSATLYSAGDPSVAREVFVYIIAYPFVVLVEILCYRGTGYGMHYLTALIRTRTYRVLFDHLSLHGRTYFSDRFSGSVSSKVNIVGGNMSRLANDLIWAYFSLFVSLISMLFFISTANVMIATVYVGAIILLIPINFFLSKPQLKLSEKSASTLNSLRGQIVDTITNIMVVHQFSQRKTELALLDKKILEHQRADIKSDTFGEKILAINNVIIMSFVTALIIGAYQLWVSHLITLGEFVMITSLSTSVIWSVSRIGQTMNEFVSTYGETKESLEEILLPHDITDSVDAHQLTVGSGSIEYKDVTFIYPDSATAVLKNFNLFIKGGQRVGFVGVSGGGKSTLLKILLREHEIQNGSVEIDHQDVIATTQESLRNAIAIVPQEPSLFHRSLRENIAYGKPDASDEEVFEAARKAQIHDFIMTLPEGYETLVGERGVKLSGGQRQRVAIARAILKAAPILVLDEATSSLDSESEVAIQKALNELMKGKTVIAIAHRLSTIRAMDRIIVLEAGNIVQDGTHDELLKDEHGTYARLWNHQAGGFLQED